MGGIVSWGSDATSTPPEIFGRNTSMKSAAVSKRLSGSRSIARRTARSIVAERVQPAPLSVGVGCEYLASMIASMVGPRNGGVPVSISYNTQPRLYTSVRGSTSRPLVCSGLM